MLLIGKLFKRMELGEPENCVEWRAQFVAHSRKELAFSLVRFFRFSPRGFARLFSTPALGYIAVDRQYPLSSTIRPKHQYLMAFDEDLLAILACVGDLALPPSVL
jgi:hypothetical protein